MRRPETGPAARKQPGQAEYGYSLIELVFVAGVMATVAGIAVPQLLASLDDLRTLGAVRYVSSRLQQTRMEAVVRSRDAALRFVPVGTSFSYTVYLDGNRNGVRSTDIQNGVDRVVQRAERLRDQFPGIDFGTVVGLPGVEGSAPPGSDPVKLGPGSMATFTASGTATTGSIYVKGPSSVQYVIRIYGETGKTRILKFDPRHRLWKPL